MTPRPTIPLAPTISPPVGQGRLLTKPWFWVALAGVLAAVVGLVIAVVVLSVDVLITVTPLTADTVGHRTRILLARGLISLAMGMVIGLSTIMFYFAYRYVPRRRPRAWAALVGGVLAAILWEAAKQLFRVYIRKVGVYDQIYGPLGVLVAFVMFVYYSAIVFVFAAAYAATLDTRRR